jgi:hypothetical protein
MTYGPPVIKQCEYCKKEYKCPNSRTSKSRFCTITCRNKSGLLPRVEYKCVNCNDKFMARPDHGAERVFVVVNAFWKTVFNLSIKSARTAAVCLPQCGHLQLFAG